MNTLCLISSNPILPLAGNAEVCLMCDLIQVQFEGNLTPSHRQIFSLLFEFDSGYLVDISVGSDSAARQVSYCVPNKDKEIRHNLMKIHYLVTGQRQGLEQSIIDNIVDNITYEATKMNTIEGVGFTTKSNWLELADQAELRLDWEYACHCYGKAIMLSNSESEKSLLMFSLKEATDNLNDTLPDDDFDISIDSTNQEQDTMTNTTTAIHYSEEDLMSKHSGCPGTITKVAEGVYNLTFDLPNGGQDGGVFNTRKQAEKWAKQNNIDVKGYNIDTKSCSRATCLATLGSNQT